MAPGAGQIVGQLGTELQGEICTQLGLGLRALFRQQCDMTPCGNLSTGR